MSADIFAILYALKVEEEGGKKDVLYDSNVNTNGAITRESIAHLIYLGNVVDR